MTWRTLNRNLDKFLKPIKYYRIPKKEKVMMHMALMDPKLQVFLASISLMLIVFFKDSSKILALIARMMKIFSALLWGGKRKMEVGEDLDSGLLCLIMIHFLVLLSEK